MPNYNLPIYTGLNRTTSGQVFSEQITNETLYVYNSMGTLYGMPDRRYRVIVSGMREIDWHSEIQSTSEYKVDYKHTGNIYFHPDFNKKTVLVSSYYSRGLQYFPASRIWTKVDGLGNVLQTLDDVITLLEDMEFNKEELAELVDYSNGVINEGNKLVIDMQANIRESKRMKDLLEILMLQSGDAIKVMQDLLVKGDELSGQLNLFMDVYQDVEITIQKLTKLNDDAEDLTEALKIQFNKGSEIYDSLTDIIPTANTANETLITTVAKGEQTIQELSEKTTIGEDVLSQLISASNTGDGILQSLVEINEITKTLIEESNEINTSMSELIESAQSTQSTLLPIVERGEDIHPKLVEDITKAQSIDESLSSHITTGSELDTQMNSTLTLCESMINVLDEQKADIKGLQEQNNTMITLGRELLSDLSQATIDGNNVLEDIQEIIEGTDYSTVLEKIEGLSKNKLDKSDVLLTFTQKEEPEMKTGDQWHKIVD